MNETNQTTLQTNNEPDDVRLNIVLNTNNLVYLFAGFAVGALATITLVCLCAKIKRMRAKRREEADEYA
jgi:hypothetical protein